MQYQGYWVKAVIMPKIFRFFKIIKYCIFQNSRVMPLFFSTEVYYIQENKLIEVYM